MGGQLALDNSSLSRKLVRSVSVCILDVVATFADADFPLSCLTVVVTLSIAGIPVASSRRLPLKWQSHRPDNPRHQVVPISIVPISR
jgi:hypothetical protein